MPFICCVPECPFRKPKFKLTVHNFPRDPQISATWIKAIGRPDLLNKKLANYRICNAHFSDDDKVFGPTLRTNLKSHAFPTLHLRNNLKEKEASHEEKPNLQEINPIIKEEEPCPWSKQPLLQVNQYNLNENLKKEPCTWSDFEKIAEECLDNASKIISRVEDSPFIKEQSSFIKEESSTNDMLEEEATSSKNAFSSLT